MIQTGFQCARAARTVCTASAPALKLGMSTRWLEETGAIARILACARFGLDEARERTDARMLEDFRDVDGARPALLDALVDGNQLQRACPQVEETLVHLDGATVELGFADAAQALLDGIGGELGWGGGDLRAAQRRQFRKLGVEAARPL